MTVVTKANVIKTTDGKFLDIARQVAEDYPEVEWDDWYIDIMTAKLLDPKRRTSFRVIVLPNLYGDILTDEAAEFQGGVGTAGSANIGKRYAMFEAIHGSAPRMVQEGRAEYADPSSMIRAGGHAPEPHRLPRPGPQAGDGPRYLRLLREGSWRSPAAPAAPRAPSSPTTSWTRSQDPRLEKKWRGYQTHPLRGLE